ncbi:Secreted protein OS=Streptomyces glaucescens OX=1907 GN=SGLAU_06625 PE=4 SV=1 [Streptomyces glaucescens]
MRRQTVAAAACVVLGLGLIGGALTGSWLVGDSADAGSAARSPRLPGSGTTRPWTSSSRPPWRAAAPGGADRTWTRIAVAPDGGCADASTRCCARPSPAACDRLLRATYTDATQSHATTVGLSTEADAAGMRSLERQFEDEGRTAPAPT